MKRILVASICVLSLAMVAGADIVPPGYAYNTPGGGTLVFSETYGTANDGAGSWTSGYGVSTLTDAVRVTVNGSQSGEAGRLNLGTFDPNSPAGKVIDIAFKGWSTTNAEGAWVSYLQINSGNGNGQAWRGLVRNNDSGGSFQPRDSGAVVDFAQDQIHVLRFYCSAWNVNNFTVDAGSEGAASTRWNQGAGDNSFKIYAVDGSSQAEYDIAWVKAYEGVSDAGSPLTPVPEPATMMCLALGSVLALRRRKK